ncbi:MAG: DctP family TRAP transporter solute-binding subunit [Deltaproteobacteria bacterium]|nr:DctP family TRAP transporter solute-binding subunit [Deltaproteobacteria bacterium]
MKELLKSRRNYFFLFLLAIALLFFFPSLGAAAQPIELKLGHCNPATESDPYDMTARKFGSFIEKYTNGKYKVNVFPNNQLGSEREMVKNLTMGSMDLAVITNAVIGAFVSANMALDLPFIFPEREVAHAVLDGPVGEVLLSKLEKLQIKGLAFSEGGFRHMINNARPINTPEDTKGIKFRVMQTPIYIGMFQALGSNAVPMPWGEVYTAVQQKVIDGLEIPIPVIYTSKYYEIVKYLSLTSHTYSPLIVMCAEQRWKKLSASDKESFKRAAQEAARYERNAMKDIVGSSLQKIKDGGMIVNEVPNKKPFQEAVKSLYKKFEGEIGKDFLESVIKARDARP